MPKRNTAEPETIHLKGALTFPNIVDFRDQLLKSVTSCRDLTVDLSGIDAIDLAGAQVLIAAARLADAQGSSFRCIHADRYRRICDFAGIRSPGLSP
ncbi:MAG: STAS domain-containing protein [Spirochaetaceae bacterium]|nr:MAG: STAS domain-containing protein [Spirochaetaceae bacterium]